MNINRERSKKVKGNIDMGVPAGGSLVEPRTGSKKQ